LKWLESRPDITAVHFQEWTPWLAAWVFRRIQQMGKKVFYTVHNVVPHRYPALLPRALMDGTIRSARRLCDGLFVHTQMLADELVLYMRHQHPPIFVVPHGVWTTSQVADAAPPLADRMAQKRLLFFGMIRRNKGLDLILKAMPLLPEFSLTIAGETFDRDYFRRDVLPVIRQLQASGARIELQNHFIADDAIAPLFASHSAILLPYTSGFVAQSGVAFMALAHELPIVASNAGGLGALMSEYQVGRVFSKPTADALAHEVRSLFRDDPVQLQNQIRAAKQHYSWHGAAVATVHGYQNAWEANTEADERNVETSSAI
jgi:glycosyltransferase involved in cell wall biosynthesis